MPVNQNNQFLASGEKSKEKMSPFFARLKDLLGDSQAALLSTTRLLKRGDKNALGRNCQEPLTRSNDEPCCAADSTATAFSSKSWLYYSVLTSSSRKWAYC